MDDPRNTDNAWTVSRAMYVVDTSNVLAKFPLMDVTSRKCMAGQLTIDPAVTEVTWAVAHKDLDMFVDHIMLLELAIELVRASTGRRIWFD